MTTAESSDPPLAILSAPGSRGDVNPMLAIAVELKKLGYECHLSVAEPYADIVQAAGVHANVVLDRQAFEAVVSRSEFWRPLTGAKRVLTEVANQFFESHLRCIQRLFRPGRTVLVAHPLDFASRVFRETTQGCVLSSVHLSPVMLRHPEFPPRLLPDRWYYRGILPPSQKLWNRLTYRLADACFLDPLVASRLNAARSNLGGLPPRRRFLHQWWRSRDQALALYPTWYAPEIAERYQSPQGEAVEVQFLGFPLDDGIYEDPKAFGEAIPRDRPLLVTTGSAHHGDLDFVAKLGAVCRSRNIPVVWCCPSNPRSLASELKVRTVGYVPLGQWLPHLRGILHHGGVGTTSRAIHAGTPQIVRPMAFDQFDNATRVERFGFGVYLRRDQDLPEAIQKLSNLPPAVAPDHSSVSPAAPAAALQIDQLLSRGPRSD